MGKTRLEVKSLEIHEKYYISMLYVEIDMEKNVRDERAEQSDAGQRKLML